MSWLKPNKKDESPRNLLIYKISATNEEEVDGVTAFSIIILFVIIAVSIFAMEYL